MNVSDGEGVRKLPTADLAPVRRLNFYAVLQPFVRDAFIVDGDLKGDSVSLLGIQVLQHGGDQNRWRTKFEGNTKRHIHCVCF